MTDDTQQQQVPVVNGVPLTELPELCQKLFDKVMALRQEVQTLAAQHTQKNSALEEIANMLAAEVEAHKARTAPTATVETQDPTQN